MGLLEDGPPTAVEPEDDASDFTDEARHDVRIEAVDARKRTIDISGADVIDGSPVLDLKPYLPPYDAPQQV